jgi:hypothetical protein
MLKLYIKVGPLLALGMVLSGCNTTGVSGETVWGAPESPVWFNSASPATQRAHFQDKCLGYGFQYGTPEFSNCMMTSQQNAEASAQQRSQQANQALQGLSQQLNCQSRGGVYNSLNGNCALPQSPVHCNTTGSLYGNTYSGNTTCY